MDSAVRHTAGALVGDALACLAGAAIRYGVISVAGDAVGTAGTALAMCVSVAVEYFVGSAVAVMPSALPSVHATTHAKLQPSVHPAAPLSDTPSDMLKATTSASKSGTAWTRPSDTPSVPSPKTRSAVSLAQRLVLHGIHCQRCLGPSRHGAWAARWRRRGIRRGVGQRCIRRCMRSCSRWCMCRLLPLTRSRACRRQRRLHRSRVQRGLGRRAHRRCPG
jgi:hypothetical protein